MRPRVILNCAMSADGKVALPSRRQLRISCDEDMARVHKLRSECDAVLVGVETVLSDNPKLTVSEHYVPHPRQPLRVVLDGSCRTPPDSLVVNAAARTVLFTRQECHTSFPQDTVEVVSGPVDADGLLDLSWVLSELSRRGIRQILVEGGGTVLWSFLRQGLVDVLFVYVGPLVVGGAQTPTLASGQGVASASEVVRLNVRNVSRLGPGVLLEYHPVNGKKDES